MMWLHLRSALICLALLVPFAAHAQAPAGDKALQAANPTAEIPKFYAESRQIIVEAQVWDPPNKKRERDTLKTPGSTAGHSSDATFVKEVPNYPMPVRGLTAKDFHMFDNGVEQKINFLKEADFPGVNIMGQWRMDPTTRGTWGTFIGFNIGFQPIVGYWVPPDATYLIGYIPPPLKYGECRTIQVVVEGHDIDVNRSRYCGLKGSDEVKQTNGEPSSLHSQMGAFGNSAGREAIKVSIQAFAFWSSGLLHLIAEPRSVDEGGVLPATDFTYVVEVHDAKAPATVQIATEFVLPIKFWEATDCRKKNPAVHVLGTVYKANGDAVAQFADTFRCLDPTTLRAQAYKVPMIDEISTPTRFDTQVELPAGDYELRIAVSDGKHFGRARLPLHVETFDGKNITISDIALSNILRDSSWVAREAANVSPSPVVPTPLVSKNVQFFPAVNMHLPRHSPLSFYFEIYEPQLKTETVAVYYGIRISDLKTGSLVMNTGPISAAKWVLAGNAVIPIGLKIATDKLKKGSYRLAIQAYDSVARETEWRQATFTIE